MFEITYMHPITGFPQSETDEKNVSYSTIGIAMSMGPHLSLFIPWHRVTSISASKESVHELMSYAAFGEA